MTETYTALIYSQEDDADSRSIHLYVHADGSVKLEAQDMGKATEQWWGDDDYEFWVNVPAKALHKLVFSLIREKYSGRSRAVDEFRAFCDKEEIENKWGSWA